jgi:hypothetical protein
MTKQTPPMLIEGMRSGLGQAGGQVARKTERARRAGEDGTPRTRRAGPRTQAGFAGLIGRRRMKTPMTPERLQSKYRS